MIRTARAVVVATVALVSATVPAAAQPSVQPFVVVDPASGAVSIISDTDVVEILAGLVRPSVVAVDPVEDRLVVGQEGPLDGSASIVGLRPGGERTTVAWNLPGIADIAVTSDHDVLFVTGTDGILWRARGIDPAEPVADTGGLAVGVAVLDRERALVVSRDGLVELVDVATGRIDGVISTAVSDPGPPDVLDDPASLCIPDAVQGEVSCAPVDEAGGFVLDGLAGVTAVASASAPDQLLVLQEGLVSLLGVPGGAVLRQWALPASDVAALPTVAPWLGVAEVPAPTPSTSTPSSGSPADGQLWLLVLGVAAGIGAVAMTLVARRLGGDRRDSAHDTDTGSTVVGTNDDSDGGGGDDHV